jgi:membrane complex biogenesis BtpA family protein
MTWLKDLFGTSRPIIAMVHLPALPGMPLYDAAGGMDAIIASMERDLAALQDGGIDGVMFGNENDRPYAVKAETAQIAAMAAAVAAVKPRIRVPFGVDLLWDASATVAVAAVTGARFAREVFNGVHAGDLGLWIPDAAAALRLRRNLNAEHVKLLFTVVAEFAAPLDSRGPAAVARSVAFTSLPDAIGVSGPITGTPPTADEVRSVRQAVNGSVPVMVNTGLRRETVADLLPSSDGAVVGTSLKYDGVTWNPVDPARVLALMDTVRAVRGNE